MPISWTTRRSRSPGPRTWSSLTTRPAQSATLAWHGEGGEWHATATGKRVQKEVDESMEKRWKKVSPEPDTDSE
eukprot:8288455-Pyramimonas_sp.AAC.1